MCRPSAQEGQERMSDFLKLESDIGRQLGASMYVLGIQSVSSGRAAIAFDL